MRGGQWHLWLAQRACAVSARASETVRAGGVAAGNLLFPPACTFCGGELLPWAPPLPLLCQPCRQELVSPADHRCARCASPLPRYWADQSRCPKCIHHRYYFDRALAIGEYRAAMQQAVLWMKRVAYEPLTRALGLELAERVRSQLPDSPVDLIVAVPMHWSRRVARGTHTAGVLATALGESLALPVSRRLLYCRRKTRKQGTLRPDARLRNMRGAFGLSSGYDITDARLLLVDDILTTGATVSEAARVLRRGGAGSVDVAVVARGVGQR